MSIAIPYELETLFSGLLVCLCGLACSPGEASDGSLYETDGEWAETTSDDTPRSQTQRNDVVPIVEPPEKAASGSCLQLIEECTPGKNICAVRCCDDSLFRKHKACGDCQGWAYAKCEGHGGPKRIRWKWN
jgi:hypothetical protein